MTNPQRFNREAPLTAAQREYEIALENALRDFFEAVPTDREPFLTLTKKHADVLKEIDV